MTLLSADEMAAIRTVAEMGLITPVTIQRRTLTETDLGSEEVYTTISIVNGWMKEVTPSGAAINEVGGIQALAGTYRLFLPIGTDIEPDDLVLLDGLPFIVQHSDAGGTYLPFLTVIMRRAD